MAVRGARLWVAVLLLGLAAVPATAQDEPPVSPPPTVAPDEPPPSVEPGVVPPRITPLGDPAVGEPAVIEPPITAPSLFPLEIPDLLLPPAPRGRVILTPSIAASVSYNDNVFRNNDNREWDVISTFSPGVSLLWRQPTFTLIGRYSFGASVHARRSELNRAFDRHNFGLSAAYQLDPRTTLSLANSFIYSSRAQDFEREEDVVVTVRRQSMSYRISPGVTWRATPLTSLRLSGSYSIRRFESETDDPTVGTEVATARGSEAYRIGGGASHTFTRRLQGSAGYDFALLDVEDRPETYTHTPRLGLTYQITRRLTGSVSGGPSFVIQEGESTTRVAATATLVRPYRWGAVSARYNRGVTTFGGLGGTAETQSLAGNVAVTTLLRGLSVGFSTRYAISERVGREDTEREVRTLSLGLSASYVVWRNVSVFGSYRFLYQRTDGTRSLDIDRNLITLGVSYAYPISFD